MPDSPRWCARCEQYGDHHTDRCPKFAQAALIARASLDAELRALVKKWEARSDDPGLNAGARSGFFFASCALQEVLRRHVVLADDEPAAACGQGCEFDQHSCCHAYDCVDHHICDYEPAKASGPTAAEVEVARDPSAHRHEQGVSDV